MFGKDDLQTLTTVNNLAASGPDGKMPQGGRKGKKGGVQSSDAFVTSRDAGGVQHVSKQSISIAISQPLQRVVEVYLDNIGEKEEAREKNL